MASSSWMKRWKGERGQGKASELLRAAARGDSIDQILDLGIRRLLDTAAGDRAGIWFAQDRSADSGRGRVMEAVPGPIPEVWKHLDIATPFLRKALESPDPLRVELGTGQYGRRSGERAGERNADLTLLQLGPLTGMRSVVWMALRARNRTLGLAMVAHAGPGVNLDLELLRACAEEIAFAVQSDRDARRVRQAAEELRAQSALSRAILCGVSADCVFPQIVRAVRHHVQAEFVTLGGGCAPPPSGTAWEGADDWRTFVHQLPLLQLWRKAFEDGRECDISGEAIPAWVACGAEGSRFMLDRVVAIPIEGRDRTYGVLMAGFQASQDSSEDFTRLEPYALLAAMAQARQFAREQFAASRQAVSRIIEGSRECLVAVDEQGVVREGSQAALALLSTCAAPPQEIRFEDFFSGASREPVAQWLRHLAVPDPKKAFENGTLPQPLETSLHRGNAVRLHLRSTITGLNSEGTRLDCGPATPPMMFLLHLENEDEQQAWRETEARMSTELAALMDSIESGILLLDAQGNIRMVNERLAVIMGVEARRMFELGTIEALMDRLANQFIRPAETVARWREQVRRAEEASWDEFELLRPSRKIVERFARPLVSPDGSRLGRLEVYRDITGQRRVQAKLLQTEKMAALGHLVSGIAHELNNPLTSIQGYAQLLLNRRSSTDRTGDARRICQEAERAARIVKNLLLFARETKPERRPVNLNEVIERTLALRAYELKLENIAVELMLDPGLPQTLADAAQLQQVILNLILNAEQAILQGRGEDDGPGRIHLRTRRLAADRVGMEVSDDGPGISPEVVSRIFDPFFTTKPPGIGTGLGLSIVYGIVQEHGGEVSVESQAGGGATLNIELPALSVSGFDFTEGDTAAAPRAAQPDSPAHVNFTTSPDRILVVEDEPTVAELIADVLTEEGHRVETLLDSREALGRMEKKHYGLVICDLKMPHLDGPALYRALVRRGSPLQRKLLLVTGDTMSPRTLEFLKSSGVPYLAKPFLVEELKEAVRQAVAALPVVGQLTASSERSPAAVRDK